MIRRTDGPNIAYGICRPRIERSRESARWPLDPAEFTIYGNHMSESTKTTVYLSDADYRRLKQLARQQGVPAAKLVREAVAEYVRKRARRLLPRSIGMGRSTLGDVSERAEEYLKGMGED